MIVGYQLNRCFYEGMELFEAFLKEGLVPSNVTLLSALSAVSGLAVFGNGRWIIRLWLSMDLSWMVYLVLH